MRGLFSWLFGSKSKRTKTEQKSAAKYASSPHQPPKPASAREAATVEFVHPKIGYAFLTRGENTPRIYVHQSTLEKHRLTALKRGQKVEVVWGETKKGLEAVELRLAK